MQHSLFESISGLGVGNLARSISSVNESIIILMFVPSFAEYSAKEAETEAAYALPSATVTYLSSFRSDLSPMISFLTCSSSCVAVFISPIYLDNLLKLALSVIL